MNRYSSRPTTDNPSWPITLSLIESLLIQEHKENGGGVRGIF